MNITTALETRKSIRAYLDKPVPREEIEGILAKALRSPSATNIQPWNIYVVTGEVLEKIKKDNLELFQEGIRPTIEEPELTGPFKERRRELAIDLFNLLGIKREDKEKRKDWTARGHKYFDAPAALILTTSNYAAGGTWSLLGIGALLQSICLAALESELGTCVSEQGVSYHEVLRKYLSIPAEEDIVISIALGYPDPDHPANKLTSKREPIDKVAHWFGFE
jgi:nitroreductase